MTIYGVKGGSPHFFWLNLIFFVTYKGMQKFKIVVKPLLGEKCVGGRRRRKKNNAKISGHYVRPHTHNVYAHALHACEGRFDKRCTFDIYIFLFYLSYAAHIPPS